MNKNKTLILLVEDEVAHAELIRRSFEQEEGRVELTVAYTLREAKTRLSEATFDLVLADVHLPDGKGIELLPGDRENAQYPVVIMTSHGNAEAAVSAMKGGAFDYIIKTVEMLTDMPHICGRILREWDHITERKHKEEEIHEKNGIIQLIHEITVAANNALTVDDAMLICLKSICRHAGWPVGHVYYPVGNGDSLVLKPSKLWYFKDPEKFTNLKTVTDAAFFKSGEGLPGWVYESRKPAWISDVTKDSNFKRMPIALEQNLDLGIKGALSFPILEGNKVASILEFFSEKVEKPRVLLIEVVANIAIQLGRVTERKRAEESLRKLSQAVEQSTMSVLITDTDGKIEYVNQRFTQMTGYNREESIGQNPCVLTPGEAPSLEYQRLWENIASGEGKQGEFQNKKKDGELYWERSSISPIRNDKGEITHFLEITEDITAHKNYETQLFFMSVHDPLTNLYNRRRFREELEYWTALSRRHNVSGGLLFLDVDDFKHINDTHGHQVGDEILVCIAGMLRVRLRETDILARLGGDEFAVILTNTDANQALIISKQLGELIRNNTFVTKQGLRLNVSMSIGVVMFPEHGSDVDTLLTCSDHALYKAKEEGKNRECVFLTDHKAQIDLQLDWKKRIQLALKEDRFVLYLQPILDIKKNTIVGYEALIRMVGEEGKIIAPDRFLPVAERFGLIREIDHWVVLNAIQIIKEKQFEKKGKFLEVNLSGGAFMNMDLLNNIQDAFNTSGINPGNLIFEITETNIVENLAKAQHFINSLKKMGCRFALDDFGNGFSSFNYLKHLPVDTLKIDGSFIRDLPQNTVDQHLVKAMVEVARGLGKETVAEYVGSKEIMQLLIEYGIDYAQGYYIGKPGKVSEILGY